MWRSDCSLSCNIILLNWFTLILWLSFHFMCVWVCMNTLASIYQTCSIIIYVCYSRFSRVPPTNWHPVVSTGKLTKLILNNSAKLGSVSSAINIMPTICACSKYFSVNVGIESVNDPHHNSSSSLALHVSFDNHSICTRISLDTWLRCGWKKTTEEAESTAVGIRLR